jgi:hypothetical protein
MPCVTTLHNLLYCTTTTTTTTGPKVGSKRLRSETTSDSSSTAIGLVSPPQSPLRIGSVTGSVSGSVELLQEPKFNELNNKDPFNLMAFELTDSDKLLSSGSSSVGLQQRLVITIVYTHSTVCIYIYEVCMYVSTFAHACRQVFVCTHISISTC